MNEGWIRQKYQTTQQSVFQQMEDTFTYEQQKAYLTAIHGNQMTNF